VAYGNREVHVHPTGTRRLSVFEAMLLQSFPKTYELRGTLSEQIMQISDAVPPPLAAAVARAIRNTIYTQPAT
jgi:DNA (cytosine-5)-methyltransferase 1